jgi:hypothetical protein
VKEVHVNPPEDDRERAGRALRHAGIEFISALRLARGMDEALFDDLRTAIIDVGAAWRDSSVLPKTVVNDLVGLFSWINSSSYFYAGDEAERIREAAREAESMTFRYVVPAEPDGPGDPS